MLALRRLAGPLVLSFAATIALLGLVLAVSLVSSPGPPLAVPGLEEAPRLGDLVLTLERNLVVLTFGLAACLATRIAAELASCPERPQRIAGRIALVLVGLTVIGALAHQVLFLGRVGATLADQLAISPALLLASALPHALLELSALLLPLVLLARAIGAGRLAGLKEEALRAALAVVPLLILALMIESYLWPRLLGEISPLA
jgi:hypothetical protein